MKISMLRLVFGYGAITVKCQGGEYEIYISKKKIKKIENRNGGEVALKSSIGKEVVRLFECGELDFVYPDDLTSQ